MCKVILMDTKKSFSLSQKSCFYKLPLPVGSFSYVVKTKSIQKTNDFSILRCLLFFPAYTYRDISAFPNSLQYGRGTWWVIWRTCLDYPIGSRRRMRDTWNRAIWSQLRSIDPIPSPSYSPQDGAWPTTTLLNLGQTEPCGQVRGRCSLVKSL